MRVALKKLKAKKMMMETIFICILFQSVSFSLGSKDSQLVTQPAEFYDHWMADINISYFDNNLNKWKSEKTETGR